MTFSMETGVFAKGEDILRAVNVGNVVPITKNFEMAEGLDIPQDISFSFVAESMQTDAPKVTINPVTYSQTDKTLDCLKEGKYTLSKSTSISFGEFPHAGVYEYVVKEKLGNLEGVTYSNEEYPLRVYVQNDPSSPNKLSITAIIAIGGTQKTDEVLFTNTYTKNGGLEIVKKTEGAYADQTKPFHFKITFEKSPMSEQTEFQGVIGDQFVSCTAGKPTEFKLCDGQKLIFKDLPVGTRYVVEEIGAVDGYTPSVNVIENAVATVQKKASQDAEGLTSAQEGKSNNLVGENENKVTFTNTYKDVPITGVIMNNLPFIVVIGVAIGAFVALAVIKKQRTSRR